MDRIELWVLERTIELMEERPLMPIDQAGMLAWAEVRDGLCPHGRPRWLKDRPGRPSPAEGRAYRPEPESR